MKPPAIDVTDLRHAHAGGSVPHTLAVPRFVLAAGASLALRGESGCGKTTFLHLLAGILRPAGGEVRIAGESMTAGGEADRDRRRARLLGLVFQTFNLLQGFTIEENLGLVLRFAGRSEPGRVRGLLERLELGGCARRFPRQLSTGQQQRVALARALVNRPALVLADEPTASLDNRLAAASIALLRELCAENGAALLLVTHDERALVACGCAMPFESLASPVFVP
jgi:putative ABC transport system ATP-binding protein